MVLVSFGILLGLSKLLFFIKERFRAE